MTLQVGEVVLIRMRFHQASGSKVRAALVLLDSGDDDFVAARITSRPRLPDHDFVIADCRTIGLNVSSCARVHKMSVLAKAEIIRTSGMLSALDSASLRVLLRRVSCSEHSVNALREISPKSGTAGR